MEEKERSRIRAIQTDNLRGLLDIKSMDRVPHARIKEFVRIDEGVNKKIAEDILRWFGHVERMKNDRIAKRVYVGVCASSNSVGRRGRDGLIP